MIKAQVKKYTLNFKFLAGTSRGTLKTKDSWILKVSDENGNTGYGEAGPLSGLSSEFGEDIGKFMIDYLDKFRNLPEEILDIIKSDYEIPSSVKFAMETALIDLINGGGRLIFDNSFSRYESKIPINGLIWMGDFEFMNNQLEEKIKEGYNCIKFKIGAIYFEDEIKLIKSVRDRFSKDEVIIRVDANGAFSFDEALEKMKILSDLDVHSIEQPIKAGTWELMNKFIQKSSLDIALDEELIGIREQSEKSDLLDTIKPDYIVLKPSLHGGIQETKEWIDLAEEREIKWWITSALESNIGLNAIAQLCGEYDNPLHQGLGTGMLYHNNIPSPLEIKRGYISINPEKSWGFSAMQL